MVHRILDRSVEPAGAADIGLGDERNFAPAQHGFGVVGAAVVHHQQAVGRPGLRQDMVDTAFEKRRTIVGDDGGENGHVRKQTISEYSI